MPVWLDPSGLKGGSLDLLKPVGAGDPQGRAPPGVRALSQPPDRNQEIRNSVVAACEAFGMTAEKLQRILNSLPVLPTTSILPSTRRP